ncbi:MAG: hypothetical protein M3Q05_00640 [Bacteroidota bacterium]|nr:hypothetical protein [Bacteroidota bacterium]
MNRQRMEHKWKSTAYYWVLLGGLAGGLLGCSSARETNETTDEPIGVTTPATIQTDEQRQQIYNREVGASGEPLPKPNLNDRASEVNRKKNIEDNSSDKPALTPNEVRPQEIKTRVNPG